MNSGQLLEKMNDFADKGRFTISREDDLTCGRGVSSLTMSTGLYRFGLESCNNAPQHELEVWRLKDMGIHLMKRCYY